MPTGLDAKTIAKLVTRFGSLPAALEQAKQDPRFEAAFREVTGLQSMTLQTGGDPGIYELDVWQLVAAWASLDDEPATPAQEARPAGRPPGAQHSRSTRSGASLNSRSMAKARGESLR